MVNFEAKRSKAHFVGQVDMGCFTFGTVILILTFVSEVAVAIDQYNVSLNDVLIYIVPLAVLIFGLSATDLFVICMLLKATNEYNQLSAKKALFWTRFWFYYSIVLLLIGIALKLYPFEPKNIIGIVIVLAIRGYMIWSVGKYLKALENRVSDIEANNQQGEIATNNALRSNNLYVDLGLYDQQDYTITKQLV